MSKVKPRGLLDPKIIGPAAIDALRKLDPRKLARNPVIFVTEVVSLVVTGFFIRDCVTGEISPLFSGQIAFWLWFTVLFANFAEAVAEGRGKAQADTLRKSRSDARAKRYLDRTTPPAKSYEGVNALDLRVGDVVLVEAGEMIPGDGEIIEGLASVNESAITGESAPVIREAGGDRSAVTGGTTVLSDSIKVRITAAAGSTFIDRMIALVEGAERQKTPNELALSILLSGLTLIFLIVCVTLWPLGVYSGTTLSATVLIALLVCLIPTTIGGLLSAIGIAGMDRLIRFNVIATSGRAVEAAGDVDTLLLDKTGTITFGNRMADEFIPVAGVGERQLAEAVTAREPRRRDAGGPFDHRAGQEPLRAGGAGRPAGRRADRAVQRPHPRLPASTCRGGRCARARSTRSSPRSASPRTRRRRISARRSIASRAPAARRSPSPTTAGCSASSTSRTSSSPTSGRASPNCARWASRR